MAEKLIIEIAPPPPRRLRGEDEAYQDVMPAPAKQLKQGIYIRRLKLRQGLRPPTRERFGRLRVKKYRNPKTGIESRRMYRGLIGIRFRDLGRRIMKVISFGR